VKLSNETKLAFYALYKQITEGPCKTEAPSRFKMIERAKWQAWSNLGKMSKEEAQKKYVEALSKAVPDWRQRLAELNKSQL